MSKWGFWVGLLILLTTILSWAFPYLTYGEKNMFDYSIFYMKDSLEVFLDIIYTPFEMIVRFLPWTLIAWMPFCMTLRVIDDTPILSHYFRVVFFATYIFGLLNPFSQIICIMFSLPSLAILCGITYDIGVRCYSRQMRKLLLICSYICVILAIIFIIHVIMNYGVSREALPCYSLSLLFILQACWIYYYRNNGQIWIVLLSVSMSYGLFYYGMLDKDEKMHGSRREMGKNISHVLREDGAEKSRDILYKIYIADFYNEGAYVDYNIQKIDSLEEINKNKSTVYLLSVDFPQLSTRNWTNLLRGDYRSRRINIWRGDLIESPELHNLDFKERAKESKSEE